MKLGFPQLQAQLGKQLLPIYLIAGDEPLQSGEAMDTVRQAAIQAGCTREVMHVGKDFNWGQLQTAANSLSLFAEKRLIELRMSGVKPGKEGGAVLRDYAQQPAEDVVLLIEAGKLERASQNTAWYKAIDKAGATVQIWPVKAAQLPAWIRQRLQARGLQTDAQGAALLAERTEGNLLAAAQEIEKLSLLYGVSGQTVSVDVRQIADSVADSSRYSVYDLVDAAMEGDTARTIRILNGLEGEAAPQTLVLWALGNEIRGAYRLAQKIKAGVALQQVLGNVWESRKPVVSKALQRVPLKMWDRLLKQCAYADQVVKGMRRGSPWRELMHLAVSLAAKGELARTEKIIFEKKMAT